METRERRRGRWNYRRCFEKLNQWFKDLIFRITQFGRGKNWKGVWLGKVVKGR